MELWTKTQKALLISNHETNEECRNLDGNTVDFQPVVKLFNAFGSGTWLISELDEENGLAFGLCDLGFGFPELGSVPVDELTNLKAMGIPMIERDIHWSAEQTLNQYASEAREAGLIACEPASPSYGVVAHNGSNPLDMNRVIQAAEECMFGTANTGFCLKCGNEQEGCEPDAEGYECEACGALAVMGAEQCLLSL